MSLLRNLLGNFMPHFESRRNTAVLNALNAELVVEIDGDNAALIHIMTSAALVATYVVEGSPDGVNYYAIPVFAFGPGSVRLLLRKGHEDRNARLARTDVSKPFFCPLEHLESVQQHQGYRYWCHVSNEEKDDPDQL